MLCPVQKRSGRTGKSDWRTELCLLWEEAEKSGAVQPKKRDLRGNLTNECEGVYEYLQGECKEDGATIFSQVPSVRIRSNEHKLEQRRFPLNSRNLCVDDVWALAQVNQRSCGISSLEIFRSHLDVILYTLLWVGPSGSRGPFPPQLFWDSRACYLQIFTVYA